MIGYPMGLPEWDLVKFCIENAEAQTEYNVKIKLNI